ncbi:MAG: OmpA family protein [Mariprofundales bacterium]
MKYIFLLVSLLLCSPLWATEALLSDPDDRITDEVVESDLQVFRAVQKRLATVNTDGVPYGAYHKAKAQALLDFSWDEYHENDRTGAIEAALMQVSILIAQLEEKKQNISLKTELLPGTAIVRQDLWDEAKKMKKHQHFHCAQEPVANMEGELLWAGHEHEELGWRHALKQIKRAEELDRQAKSLLELCKDPAPKKAPSCIPASRLCAPPVAFIPMPLAAKPNVPSHRTIVYFDLDKDNLQATGPGTLNAALEFIRKYPDAYRIRIEAHTDRLSSTNYNQGLSERRAKTVRDYFTKHGIDASIMETSGYGEERPVVFCENKDYRKRSALVACLQKNRRAEILLYTPDGK